MLYGTNCMYSVTLSEVEMHLFNSKTSNNSRSGWASTPLSLTEIHAEIHEKNLIGYLVSH